MKHHRWTAASEKPKRHHARCTACALVRTREPGSHAHFFARPDGAGRMVPVENGGLTPPCTVAEAQ